MVAVQREADATAHGMFRPRAERGYAGIEPEMTHKPKSHKERGFYGSRSLATRELATKHVRKLDALAAPHFWAKASSQIASL